MKLLFVVLNYLLLVSSFFAHNGNFGTEIVITNAGQNSALQSYRKLVQVEHKSKIYF